MAPEQHHHRSTTKQAQKPFKSRHATKSALKERSKGKIEYSDRGVRRTPHQQLMTKLTRRNQAKQKRLTQRADHEKATSVFAGKDGAPRVVAVIPLTADVSSADAVRALNGSVDVEDTEVPEAGVARAGVERFKQRLLWTMARREMLAALDAARGADFVVFVLSAEEEVDEMGEMLVRCVEGQGISNCLAVVQGLEKVDTPKRKQATLASLKSFITHFLPTVEKVHSLDSRQECANVVRSLCTTTPKGIRWREDRSWMMVEEVRWPSGKSAMTDSSEGGEVILTGVVRGRSLKADRLVQIGDWGDFQIEKITAAPLETHKKGKAESMTVDMEGQDQVLDEPTEDRDDLQELAPEEAVMDDANDYAATMMTTSEKKGVLLDDHHYFSDEEKEAAKHRKPKRLPKGTSNYQSAWYLDDVSDSGSDLEDVDEDMEEDDIAMDGPSNPADGMDMDEFNAPEPTEAGGTEYPQSEMFLDPSPEDEAEQIAAYRKQRKTEAEDDLEFPDEIELNPNVLARERLARYRGLKSFKTSSWETEEDKPHEPAEWARLLEIADYKGAKSRVLKETLVGGVKPGTRVHVHLRGVPLSFQRSHNPSKPLTLFSLLRHEHKHTAVNYSITLSSDYPAPIKSKEELILQCGPRRFVINPLFSQAGNTPNDVHKFNRYLHPGQSAITTFIGPLTWGSVPALFFKRGALPAAADADASNTDANEMTDDAPAAADPTALTLIATGTSLAPSTNRVIAKRIILTGHPYKIHKKLVTVRYMFFSPEDVQWFKALQLWTRRGRQGYIKESLGTHGYFKATFDGKINPMDAVAVSLYKRVWPKGARAWRGEVEEVEEQQ